MMQKYQGSCHCGAVRFEAETDLAKVIECNCSHCSKKGFLLSFVPRSAFTLLSGEGKLTEYRFNKKIIQHLFCSVCGVQAFGYGSGPEGAEMAAINVRCLDGVDTDALDVTPVNGKDW